MAYTSIITDVLLLLMGFALLAYVCSFFFYKVFAKYIDEEPVERMTHYMEAESKKYELKFPTFNGRINA